MSKRKPRQRRTGCGALFAALGAIIGAIVKAIISILGWLARTKITLPIREGRPISLLVILVALLLVFTCCSFAYNFTTNSLRQVGILPTYTPTPTNTPTSTPTPTPTRTPMPTNAHTPTATRIPTLNELIGQEFSVFDLPETLQAKPGEAVQTLFDDVRVELVLQEVSSIEKENRYRHFVTTFHVQNPSERSLVVSSEAVFHACGNAGNWRRGVVVLENAADFQIAPSTMTKIDLKWYTRAYDNPVVWIIVNADEIGGRGRTVKLGLGTAVFRIELPPIPTPTPTPTRTPVVAPTVGS